MNDALQELRNRHKTVSVPAREDDLLLDLEEPNETTVRVEAEDDWFEEKIKISRGRTIRLSETANTAVVDYCHRLKITQDTLFEALFEAVCDGNHKGVEHKVLRLARTKIQERKEIALTKAAVTRINNIKKKK